MINKEKTVVQVSGEYGKIIKEKYEIFGWKLENLISDGEYQTLVFCRTHLRGSELKKLETEYWNYMRMAQSLNRKLTLTSLLVLLNIVGGTFFLTQANLLLAAPAVLFSFAVSFILRGIAVKRWRWYVKQCGIIEAEAAVIAYDYGQT